MNEQLLRCLLELGDDARALVSSYMFRLDVEQLPAPALVVTTDDGACFAAGDASRKELLEQLRAGELDQLQVDAVTYIQRETPNRNFVRFKEGALRSIAKSGVGTPFLRNHDQHDVLARGGTMLSSTAKKNDAGEWEFHQKLVATKLWAMEGLLDGTLDRFSIGWMPTGEIQYRHNGKNIFEDEDGRERYWPAHWPGDALEDGTIIEWVFTKAELIETSAVNVPGVVGTGVTGLDARHEFRAALSAHLDGISPARNGGRPPLKEEETVSFKKLLAALGLSADASEDSALAVVEKRELEARADREAHDRTRETLAERDATIVELEKFKTGTISAVLDGAIGKLYAEGKLVRLAGVGKDSQPDAYEATLREIHVKLGAESFAAAAARLVARVPVGRQADPEDPQTRANDDSGNVVILSDRHRKFVGQMGMSEERYAAAMKRGGKL